MTEREEMQLLAMAHRWFNITYGMTAEQAGYSCVKIWYKPIMQRDLKIRKYAEVVFGPREKEVDALIKAQKLIRWSLIVTIWAIFAAMLTIIAFIATINIYVLGFGAAGALLLSLIFFILGPYVKSLEKIYNNKVLTYMD